MKLRHLWFTLLVTLLALVAYGQYGQPGVQAAPRIERFEASSPTLISGEPVTLTWALSGGPPTTVSVTPEVGEVRDASVTVRPVISTVYTLLAQNQRGSEQRRAPVLVQAPNAPAATDTEPPEGTFGLSRTPDGPFLNDRPGGIENPTDERIIRVSPSGEFFAQVSYEDPSGIADIDVNLVNNSPPDLSRTLSATSAPFALVGEPTGDCNLAERPTQVSCVYRVQAAGDAQNITALEGAGEEFAYVFRTRVTDGAGNTANQAVRGYIIVTALN